MSKNDLTPEEQFSLRTKLQLAITEIEGGRGRTTNPILQELAEELRPFLKTGMTRLFRSTEKDLSPGEATKALHEIHARSMKDCVKCNNGIPCGFHETNPQ